MTLLRPFLRAFILLQAFHVALASADILYVDDDAPLGGNGTSWNSAYKFLQDALTKVESSAAGTFTEIRIAQGRYRPDQSAVSPNGSMSRTAFFYLIGTRNINGVAIKGGYAGYGAPSPDMRDIDQFETILTGDLAANDTNDPGSWADNSIVIMNTMSVNATTTLSGVTFTGGNANSGSVDGAAMQMWYNSDLLVEDVKFVNNRATRSGGAVFNDASLTIFRRCTFLRNTANDGGAVWASNGWPRFENCRFKENTVINDGGAVRTKGNPPSFHSCSFDGNQAGQFGGAMFLSSFAGTPITNSTFLRNSARAGGAVYVVGSPAILTNNTMFGNTATVAGGYGGAMYLDSTIRGVTVKNSILWGNLSGTPANQIGLWGGSIVTVTSSDIEGGWGTNLASDPKFTNASTGDLTLLSTSPCKDTGDTSAFPNAAAATDLAGNPRLVGSAIDMGAYEFQGVQAPVISTSSPPNYFVDALEDRDATSGALLGTKNISLTFSEPVTSAGGSAIGAANFQVRCVRNGVAASDLQTALVPSVTQVSGSGAGPYTLQLSQRICLGAWTEIKAINVVSAANGTPLSATGYDNRVVLGNLPMDITQDGKVLGDDIGRWLAINSNAFNPAPLTKLLLLDQKRDGLLNGPDINRAIQLLNGIGSFRIWNQFDMGARP